MTCTQAQTIPPSVLPGLGSSPARQAVDIDQPPWRGVVRVQTEIGVHCTGALVGPRTVLTAAHCLFGRGTGHLVRPSSIHVLSAFSHGNYAGHARAVSVEIGAGFALAPNGQKSPASPPDADWAVLTIDAPLGTPDRLLPIAHRLPPIGTAAMLAGYEQDRAQILLADLACQITGAVQTGSSLMLSHSCAGTRGVSGAPLLTRQPDRSWAIAGVASVARLGAAGGEAVPIDTIAARSDGLMSHPSPFH